jgi:hypothetical protein
MKFDEQQKAMLSKKDSDGLNVCSTLCVQGISRRRDLVECPDRSLFYRKHRVLLIKKELNVYIPTLN